MDVISVDSASLQSPALENTREFTQERNPMDVLSVDNTSLKSPVLKDTIKLIHCDVCGNTSVIQNIIKVHKVVHTGFKLFFILLL